jgi:hypothetical protein
VQEFSGQEGLDVTPQELPGPGRGAAFGLDRAVQREALIDAVVSFGYSFGSGDAPVAEARREKQSV